MRQEVFAFDFDGTLTTRDTLLEFIRYSCGTRAFICGFLLYSPLLVLMKLHLYPNYKAKQRVFNHFFGGMDAGRFNGLCEHFARDCRHLLRQETMGVLRRVLSEGGKVAVVSASIDNWVAPFFSDLNGSAGCLPRERNAVTVVGTRIEIKDGRVTGRFITPNCYGPEKVRRLLEIYPDRQNYRLTAFGDSRGDREMLAFADESHIIK